MSITVEEKNRLMNEFATKKGDTGSCESRAAEKKLAGAAKTSFMKKCEADAQGGPANDTCTKTAGEKKLAGAAKTSFMKKCEADAKAAEAKAQAASDTTGATP